MNWPTPQDFNEAMQNPEQNLGDTELRAGELNVNQLGLPVVASGAFASVYQISCGEKKFAVRCFLQHIPDQQARYEHISKYVMSDTLPYTVDFHYVAAGIRIKGKWYPILKMDWVQGLTLDSYVRRHLAQSDKLAAIASKFKTMMRDLRHAGIAHGDLQHGNIMVTSEEELRLVDYDGMFVPDLKGLPSLELGHRNYQHPARDSSHFDPRMDNFSAWSIYTSLTALSQDQALCEKLEGCDECLLFRQQDYRYPLRSNAFIEMESKEGHIKEAARKLRTLLSQPVPAIPFLDETLTVSARLPALQARDRTMVPARGQAIAVHARDNNVVIQSDAEPAEQDPELATRHYWPSLPEYINAVSNPSRNFIHPQMQSYTLQREQGIPKAAGSKHGAVFSFKTSDRKEILIKVFLQADLMLEQRYDRLYRYLHGEGPDHVDVKKHFVDFTYFAASLKVGDKYLPLVQMQKKKLPTLFETVESNRNNKMRMNALINQFCVMMSTLQSAAIVHGDIEPDNILVDKDYLVLIDYDLTTVPLSRPLASPLLGRRHYQHPRLKQGGSEVSDNFSAWILYYSLKLLLLYPTFWNDAGAKPGRLLFHADDLKRPGSSLLFARLKSHFNEEVRTIAARVEALCRMQPHEVPRFNPMPSAAELLDSMLMRFQTPQHRGLLATISNTTPATRVTAAALVLITAIAWIAWSGWASLIPAVALACLVISRRRPMP